MARYIDADALLSKYGEKCYKDEITAEEYYNLKIPLDYAPTADVKLVVRGENLGGGAFLCSACGFDDVAHSHTVKFCPNCGAEIINARPADEDDSGLQK